MRHRAYLAVALIVVALLAGCGSDSSSSSTVAGGAGGAKKTYKIGSLVFDTTIPYFQPLVKAEQAVAAKHGIELDLQNGQSDLAKEAAILQQFVTQKKDAILVSASDAEGVVPVLKQANAAGIPVFAVSGGVGKGVDVVTSSIADNIAYGEMQAKMLVEAIGETGSVAYIMGALGTSPQIDRKIGFERYLKKYPGIKIVQTVSAAWDNAKALAATQDFLTKYPKGKLDAIVDQGPEVVSGAAYAHKNGRGEVKFLTGDLPVAVQKAMKQGIVDGTVRQDPAAQGGTGVEDAFLWLSGQRNKVVRPLHLTQLTIVKKRDEEKYQAY
jgi:ABC-type sugar transport system substrate-binding protein